MTSEAATLPQHLSETLQSIRADLENVQREVEQALAVWRTTLVNEKREFQSTLQEKEKDWAAQEAEWQTEKATFEKKIGELEQFYRAQTASLEQNALQALNELDDSWQRDKVLWNQAAHARSKDLEKRAAVLSGECQRREATENVAQARVIELSAALGERNRLADEASQLQKKEREGDQQKIQELERALQELQESEQALQTQAVEAASAGWTAHQLEWEAERATYESKLQALEETFQSAVQRRGESHAAALTELKTAWDQEKTVWEKERAATELRLRKQAEAFQSAQNDLAKNHAGALETLQSESARERAQWLAERNAFESNLRASREEFQIAQRNLERTQSEAAETLKSAWDRDKMLWQDALQQMLQRFSQSEKGWAEETQALKTAMKEKDLSIAVAETAVKDLTERLQSTDTFLSCELAALQNQLDLLNQVFELASRPAHPLRRKTDMMPADAVR